MRYTDLCENVMNRHRHVVTHIWKASTPVFGQLEIKIIGLIMPLFHKQEESARERALCQLSVFDL